MRRRLPQIVGLATPESLAAPDGPAALRACDVLEIRADLFGEERRPALVAEVRALFPDAPLLFSVRLRRDGGAWPDERAGERLPLFEAALRSGEVSWIDVEADEEAAVRALAPLRAESSARLLVSNHRWGAPASAGECEREFARALALGPDGVKLVWTLREGDDDRPLLEFLEARRDDPRLMACFAMGEGGRGSRLLAPLAGVPWSYGFVGSGAPAPGQWRVSEMRDCFAEIAPPGGENGLNRLKSDLERWEKSRFSTFGRATLEDA